MVKPKSADNYVVRPKNGISSISSRGNCSTCGNSSNGATHVDVLCTQSCMFFVLLTK